MKQKNKYICKEERKKAEGVYRIKEGICGVETHTRKQKGNEVVARQIG